MQHLRFLFQSVESRIIVNTNIQFLLYEININYNYKITSNTFRSHGIWNLTEIDRKRETETTKVPGSFEPTRARYSTSINIRVAGVADLNELR